MENFDDRGNPHEDTRAARYPEGQGDPLPSTPDRPFTKRLGRLALPLLLIALTGFTAYNTLSVTGALRATFPNTQVFSIGVAYSFANSQGSVLLPGGTASVNLTIVSAVNQPTNLNLAFNTTNPAAWGYQAIGSCYPAVTRSLYMTVQGNVLLPSNTDLGTPANCIDSGRPGPGIPTSLAITVNPGTNTYTGIISVDPSASLSTIVQISWSVSQ